MVRVRQAALAAAVSVSVLFSATGALAAAHIDPSKVQVLATQIEAAITALGPDATSAQDVAAIQGAIAKSGADPYVARAALHLVQAWNGDTPNGSAAVASVDQTITEALEGSSVPHSGGPGGGTPIGAPPSYVSGGGSDYTPR